MTNTCPRKNNRFFWLAAGLVLSVAGSAAAATLTASQVTPQPRRLTGFPTPVVGINELGTNSQAGVATFDFDVDEAGSLKFLLNGAPFGATVEVTAAETITRTLSVSNASLSRGFTDTNTFRVEFRPTGTAESASPTATTTYVIIVDQTAPDAPKGVQAQGADEAILVTWDAPGRSNNEVIDGWLVSYSTESFADLTTQQATAQPSQRVSTNEALVEGLQNGKQYYATVRAVDWVGKTSDFPRNAQGEIVETLAQPVTTVTLADLAGENGGCFIATAAYGSYEEAHVRILRQFRDRVLLGHAPGRAFVSFYYRVSPPIADWIRESETARAAVRIGLLPLIAFSYAVLHPAAGWGFAAAGILGLLLALGTRRKQEVA